MLEISKQVRDAIKFQLADPTTGFNAQVAALASTYGIVPFTIDFTGADTSFIFGDVSPDIVESIEATVENMDPTSPISYVLMTVDTLGSRDTGLVMNATFGGEITGNIKLTLSFENSQTIPDFASWDDVCEAAIFNCFNNPADQGGWITEKVIYDRRMQFNKGQIVLAGGNFRRTLQFLPAFRIIYCQ